MEREIKFKAWDGHQMCEWKLHQNPNVDNDISFRFVGEDGFCYPWEHPDLIKLQWVGAFDWRHIEIYEGHTVTDGEFSGVVKYEPQGVCWVVQSEDGRIKDLSKSMMTGSESGIDFNSWEIIGNIYQDNLN